MTSDHEISAVLHQFNLNSKPDLLSGGIQPAYRVGDVVLKRVEEDSLENNHSPALIAWIAEFSKGIQADGFRSPKPIQTINGRWITADGWTAWHFLEGRHAVEKDVPQCIAGIWAFHSALRGLSKHPIMDDNRTPWGKADRWCWGEKPGSIQSELRDLVDQLYALRKPVAGLKSQLIHGDLSPENILIAPNLPPAILDFSPFWGPVEFALAIFANFIGPRRGSLSALKYFKGIKHFDQLLIRAGIRMLLVMSVIDYLEDWDTCSEKLAAELIVEYVSAAQERQREDEA